LPHLASNLADSGVMICATAMPELPEVETLAADLRPLLRDRAIVSCELRCPSLVRYPDPARFVAVVENSRIQGVDRRGKYLLIRLEGGDLLVVHLGMTGHLRVVDAGEPEPPHLHAVFPLDDGRLLRYDDVRRFGRLLAGSEAELLGSRSLPNLGPEPIDPHFTAADLYRRVHRSRAPVKALLLDQAVVAGVGNIYADEACFRARVRPDRRGETLSRRAVGRLRAALEESLGEAIRNRGSTIDDYRDAWGEFGGQQERLLVYGHAGEPCPRCGAPLRSARIGGRTTVFCRRCQR
jgi:formamidopyrimidine-DNA glycosylase